MASQYIQWTILSLIYLTIRMDLLVHKGLKFIFIFFLFQLQEIRSLSRSQQVNNQPLNPIVSFHCKHALVAKDSMKDYACCFMH